MRNSDGNATSRENRFCHLLCIRTKFCRAQRHKWLSGTNHFCQPEKVEQQKGLFVIIVNHWAINRMATEIHNHWNTLTVTLIEIEPADWCDLHANWLPCTTCVQTLSSKSVRILCPINFQIPIELLAPQNGNSASIYEQQPIRSVGETHNCTWHNSMKIISETMDKQSIESEKSFPFSISMHLWCMSFLWSLLSPALSLTRRGCTLETWHLNGLLVFLWKVAGAPLQLRTTQR